MSDFVNCLDLIATEMENRVKSLFVRNISGDAGVDRLVDASLHSLVPSGRGVRAFLVIESCKLFAMPKAKIIDLATAVELVHTYSLIHDDLPALDNSDERRGRASCHKRFDEATALLVGNTLLSKAVELMSVNSGYLDVSDYVRCKLILELMKAIGVNGMMAGQMLDVMVNNSGFVADEECLIKMNKNKTGALFSFCMKAGAIVSQTSGEELSLLENIGYDIGLVYQMIDDLEDGEFTAEQRELLTGRIKETMEEIRIRLLKFRNSESLLEFLNFLNDKMAKA